MQSLWSRLRACTADTSQCHRISLYLGIDANEVASQAVIALHTVQTALIRLPGLLGESVGARGRVTHAVIDECDVADAWVELLLRVCLHMAEKERLSIVLMSATMPTALLGAGLRHVHLGARPYAVRVVPVHLLAAGDWKEVAADLARRTARVGEASVVFATGESETQELEDLVQASSGTEAASTSAARPSGGCTLDDHSSDKSTIRCVRCWGGVPACVKAERSTPHAPNEARVVLATEALARGGTLFPRLP